MWTFQTLTLQALDSKQSYTPNHILNAIQRTILLNIMLFSDLNLSWTKVVLENVQPPLDFIQLTGMAKELGEFAISVSSQWRRDDGLRFKKLVAHLEELMENT